MEFEPYKIFSSKFLGSNDGRHTYELTFNQSLEHTGRFTGIEQGLDAYRQNEIKEREQAILREAEEIKARINQ